MRKGLYAYPWDLRDEGVDTVVGRMRDAGLDSLSLATSYHAGRFVRPHGPGSKLYFPEDGTVYFRTDPGRYGRLQPRPNSMVGTYDGLGELARAAPDIHITGWTIGLHNTPIGMAHPSVVARNAFGDPMYNSLCPAQPDVREYLVALCTDLAENHPVDEIAIETPGWQAFRHGHHHEFELIEMPACAQILMGLCFCGGCESEAAAAGLDLGALARRARIALETFFSDDVEPGFSPATDEEWAAFIDCRTSIVTSLIAEVRAAMPRDVKLAVIPTTQSPNRLCWIEGSDPAALAAVADRLEVPAYQQGPAAIAGDVAEVCSAAGDLARLGFILRPTHPSLRGAEEVRAAVQTLVAANPDSISFYNYGHMRLSSLDWIASAF